MGGKRVRDLTTYTGILNRADIMFPVDGSDFTSGMKLTGERIYNLCKGADGKNVFLRNSAGYIQWQKEGDGAWTNLVDLSTLKGADGKQVELQTTVDKTYIQWRLTGGTWANLIAISDLRGPKGADAVNPNFSFTTKSLASNQTPTATVTGTYPNLNIELAIPSGKDSSSPNFQFIMSMLAVGATPTATVTGIYPNLFVTLGIPAPKNADNPVWTLTTEKGAPGSNPAVAVLGTYPNQTLKFTIPEGLRGLQGKPLTVLANGNYANYDEVQAKYVDSGIKATATVDLTGVPVTFTEAGTRTNIVTGEILPVILGKIKKYFSDLKALAFKDKVDWGTDIDNKPALKNVATTGSYNDLSDKPTIPAAQVSADWNATSGIAKIVNKPAIPTKTSELINDSDFQTAVQVEELMDEKIANLTPPEPVDDSVMSVAIGGNMEVSARNFHNPYANNAHKVVSDAKLAELNLSTIEYNSAHTAAGDVELYMFIMGSNASDTLKTKFTEARGKYCHVRWYVYSKQGVFPATLESNRLGVTAGIKKADNTTYYPSWAGSNVANYKTVTTSLSPNLQQVDCVFLVDFQAGESIVHINLATVWLKSAGAVPAGFVAGDFGVTGLTVCFFDTLSDATTKKIKGDWQPVVSSGASSYAASSTGTSKQVFEVVKPYNNLPYNLGYLSEFLRKYQLREVDEFNQLTITCPGDSVFGRVDKGSGWSSSAPEISLTPDMNSSSEVRAGYVTGHFPPNMWERTVPCQVLDLLQYPDARDDVKYYNHTATEVVKTGTWTDKFPLGADSLRACETSAINAAMTLTFTGAKFCKLIYTCYWSTGSPTRKIKVTISADGGSTWKTPAQLSLTESLGSDAEGSGIYYFPSTIYKLGCLQWKGFDPTKTYKIKIEKADAVGVIGLWGFETWSLPRINVVVTAEGGNTAADQLASPHRFYCKMYNPALVVYELPYLNDLGVGIIPKYKGEISPATAAPGSKTAQDFYYCTEPGTYTNFGNLKSYKGAYIEWDGSKWIPGSTQLATSLATYQLNNDKVLERLAVSGVPVLTLITHNSTAFLTKTNVGRPFTYTEGLSILRNLIAKYGLASIDTNYYQIANGLHVSIQSDGCHLNDAGTEMYRTLLSEIFSIPADKRFVAPVPYQSRKLKGSETTSGAKSFGFEFAKIPVVRVYNNSGITISNITQSGFTATGSGGFEWEAYIA